MLYLLFAFFFLAWTLFRVSVFIEIYYTINNRGARLTKRGLSKAQRGMKPFEISVYELFSWFVSQDPNFIFHYFVYNPICIFCLRNLTPWLIRSVTDDMIVHFCLNTTAVIFLKHVSGSTYCLEMKNIGWHTMPKARFQNSFRLCVNVDEQKVLSFTFNGEDILNRRAILAMMLMNLSVCIHPMIHSYQNALYESLKRAPSKYWRMAVHGQYLNENCHTRPSGAFTGFDGSEEQVKWFEEMMAEHATRPIPVHADFDKRLLNVSPFLRFARQARPIVFQELKRAKLEMVDAEAYFLCSIVHSMDHWQAGKYGEWVDFGDDLTYTPRFNYVHRNFLPHTHYWFLPDNYLRSHYYETELYGRIYSRLTKIDPNYADIISLSISY